MIQLDYEYIIPFATLKEGKRAAADSLPTAILYRNGVASGLTITVSTTETTGRYHVTFTTLAGWAKTDQLYLDVQATIDVEVFDEIIWDSFAEPDAVMRGTENALLAANYTAPANADIAAILVDTDVTIPGLIATSGSDATLAKQEEILAAVAAVEGSDATLAKQEEILAAVAAVDANNNEASAIADLVLAGLESVSIIRQGPEYDAATGTITLIAGDDYLVENDGALTFAVALPGLDLTGASAVFATSKDAYKPTLRGTAELLDPETEPKIRLQWTRAQTNVDVHKTYTWGVAILDAGGKVKTVIGGPLNLKAPYVDPAVVAEALSAE